VNDDISARFGLGPVDQIGYAVEDMNTSLPRYQALFGPFTVSEADLPGCSIRGREADCRLKLAVNRSGPIEIELIEVLAGETTHTEHLRRCGEGPHHVRFAVSEIDAKLAALQAAGYEVVLYKRFSPTVAFAYVETPPELGRSVIELLQMS
jgi:methylmalonyl-CoA/ethylmalonyl-CoA epimerase